MGPWEPLIPNRDGPWSSEATVAHDDGPSLTPSRALGSPPHPDQQPLPHPPRARRYSDGEGPRLPWKEGWVPGSHLYSGLPPPRPPRRRIGPSLSSLLGDSEQEHGRAHAHPCPQGPRRTRAQPLGSPGRWAACQGAPSPPAGLPCCPHGPGRRHFLVCGGHSRCF